MRVVSVNVGAPRTVEWRGRRVRSAIWKSPVSGPVALRGVNLAGDRQTDPRYHGGPRKAVYLYPAEHYAFWRAAMPGVDLPWGAFGENLTIEGLLEADVRDGDHIRTGSAELVVTEPRLPCYKLQVRFDRDDVVQRFMDSGRTGFYAGVAREGEIAAGDALELVPAAARGASIADVVRRRQARATAGR